MDELVQQYIYMFKENANVPIKITYMDYTGVIWDDTTQSYEGNTPTEKTIYKKCMIKYGKQIGEDNNSILLSSIPAGKIGVYFIWDSRINLLEMSEESKKSLKFELYYNNEYPTKLNPEEQTGYIQYFNHDENYPIHQVFVCGVEE